MASSETITTLQFLKLNFCRWDRILYHCTNFSSDVQQIPRDKKKTVSHEPNDVWRPLVREIQSFGVGYFLHIMRKIMMRNIMVLSCSLLLLKWI